MKYLEIKGQLARLLATENLIVEHNPKATTASFDVMSRILTLPVITSSSEYVYNMLIGHEVGHALWTPKDWIQKGKAGTPKSFLNVIEDVRIEKMIQRKFPGIRKDFSKGYDELDSQDFFEIAGKDINKFNLIDRINLRFKLGVRRMIQFTTEEMKYVDAVDNCETYEDVARVAYELAMYLKQRQEEPVMTGKPSKSSNSGDSRESDDFILSDDEDGEGEDDSSRSITSGDDEKDDSNKDGEGKDGEGKEGKEGKEGEGEDGESKGKGKDGEGKDGDSDSSNQGGDSAGSGDGSDPVDEEVSETQKSFDEALGKIMKTSLTGYIYIDRPTYRLDREVISVSSISVSYRGDKYEQSLSKYQEFLASAKSEVSHMVSRFEMKKSADAYAKQEVRKTGVLDTRLLHQYKIQDDIFKRNSINPDGKNHGMVMLLDFSGSMSSRLKPTMEQIIILIEFCKKVGIPYDVYTFTSRCYGATPGSNDSANQSVPLTNCSIAHVISSSCRYKDNMKNIVNLYAYCRKKNQNINLQMGGTPLNNTLFLVPTILEEFVKRTRAQKVSFVCVTDGESERLSLKNSSYLPYNAFSDKILIRQKNGKVFDLGSGETGRIANWIQDVCPFTSVTNIFLSTKSSCKNYASENQHVLDEKVFDAENCAHSRSEISWPNICCIDPDVFSRKAPSLDICSGHDLGLSDYTKSKKSTKVVLTAIVDEFA